MHVVFEANVKNPILVRERRAALADAAARLFADKGYHGSRIRDVVKVAGMSHGGAYNYVRSKADLLYLVCQEYLTGYKQAVSEAIAGVEEPRDRLHALLVATIAVTRKYHSHHLVLQRELHCLEPRARAPFLRDAAKFRRVCEEILIAAAKHEKLLIKSTVLSANILIHLPSLVVVRRWDLKGPLTDAEIDAELIAFMKRGLGLDERRPAKISRRKRS